MARRTKEEAMATRRSIQRAALTLFSSRGVAETTLAEVARTAGVTRGAIYWHFANKDALLRSLRDETGRPYEQLALEGMKEDEPDPLGKLKTSLRSILRDLAEDDVTRQVFQIWLDRGMLGNRDRGENTHAEFLRRDEARAKIEAVLRNAVRRGQLPKTFNTRLGALAVLAFIDGSTLSVLLTPPSRAFKKDMERLTEAFFRSLDSLARSR